MTLSLKDELFGEAYHFQFFQAVRLLRFISPERLPVGRVSEHGNPVAPWREHVRFRTQASLDFPPSQIHEFRENGAQNGNPPEMVVSFMGLTGPVGVLPPHYTEIIADRLRVKDRTLHDFLDLFNHRMISLFYRAWEKYRFPLSYERGSDDLFTESLLSLVGLGTAGLRNRMGVRDESLLPYSGLAAQKPHSASALAAVIGEYFEIPASVAQFTGQWLELEPADRTWLGRANSQLGVSSVAGARIWDRQSKFRVRLGPLAYDRFTAFLPVGTAFNPVRELTRYFVGLEVDFDVQLVLFADQVPASRLDTRSTVPPRLGWTSWLKTKPFAIHDDQVVLAMNQ
jgi:type VI secretion system protein ImpH